MGRLRFWENLPSDREKGFDCMWMILRLRCVVGWIHCRLQNRTEILNSVIEAIETDTETGLTPEHARHVIEILCTIPKAIEEKRILPLHTEF